MSSLSSAPAASIPRTPAQTRKQAIADSALIDELIALSIKNPKLVKATEAPVPGCEDVAVKSWKMNEFKYYDIPSPFPTLARGLFTTHIVPSTSSTSGEAAAATPEQWAHDSEVQHRIVIRGYDKFFNIGEVPWTTWEALKAHMQAPYVLSLKSNGCIIFIAAITPTKVMVTSKHSVGTGEGSHAGVGRRWLNTYLSRKGRSESDLASVLWANRWTAIAELCDDSFEEHVLPYPPHLTGLHLHGLNIATGPFTTLPASYVDAFADEWGFIRTRTTTLDSIEDVKTFTDQCAETGTWDGEAVEGFVVRTHVSSPPTEKRATKSGGVVNVREGQSPYAHGSDFFFKIKFDEPYMMYRDWREVTKMLLSTKEKNGVAAMKASSLPKSKMRRRETVEYVEWVVGDIKRHPELFAEFGKGKGIIAARERFYRWKEGGGVVEAQAGADVGEETVKRKTIVAPVAIPGCGKTSVSLALGRLFGWAHTQSDNVQSRKKSAVIFVKNVENLLNQHDVVIADKNNHLSQHRKSLRDLANAVEPRARVIALDWSASIKSQPPASVHRISSDRIWRRGEAHQTLKPDAPSSSAAATAGEEGDDGVAPTEGKEKRGPSNHEQVLWMFINGMEELQPNEVDPVIDMELVEDCERSPDKSVEENEQLGMETQLHRALDGLCPLLHLPKPSDDAIREALLYVRTYKNELGAKNAELSAKATSSLTKKEKQAWSQKGANKAKLEEAAGVSGKAAKKAVRAAVGGGGAVRYFGVLPEVDVERVVEGALERLWAGGESGGGEGRRESLEAFWRVLKDGRRVTPRPHVTIVHKNELRGDTGGDGEEEDAATVGLGEGVQPLRELWERCVDVYEMSGPPLYECELQALVWDGRTLAIAIDGLNVEGSLPVASGEPDDLVEWLNNLEIDEHTGPSNAQRKVARGVVDALSERRKARLHITVGTAGPDIKPVEAGWLVRRWKESGERDGLFHVEGGGAAWCVKLGGERVRGALKGLVA